MSEDRWLRVAAICCGAERRLSVFEPLVADWQRQWRESRGLRCAWVMASGVAAFVRSLVACFDAIQLAHSKPTMAPVLTLVVFTFAAVAVQSLPFHYTWRPWQWSELEILPLPPDFDGLWLVPRYVGVAVMVAVLPVAMLASASRWPWRKWITPAAAPRSMSINALGVWWIFGWIALALLSFWSVQLRIVLGTRAALLLWLPQLTLVFVGAAALSIQRSRALRV